MLCFVIQNDKAGLFSTCITLSRSSCNPVDANKTSRVCLRGREREGERGGWWWEMRWDVKGIQVQECLSLISNSLSGTNTPIQTQRACQAAVERSPKNLWWIYSRSAWQKSTREQSVSDDVAPASDLNPGSGRGEKRAERQRGRDFVSAWLHISTLT